MMSSTSNLPKVGFIGLGVMGTPMSTHLSRAGYPLVVYDIRTELAVQLAAELSNTSAATSPAEVAASSDIIVTMLPNGEVVREVLCAEDGVYAGLRPGSLLLDTSSSEPWLTQQTAEEMRAKGCSVVDAPVSGAQHGAKTATLVFMVGGDDADVERVRPLLQCMGRAIYHLGGVGAGHAMKCLNNMITSMNLLALAEGLAVGTRYGLDPAVMTDVINESTGGSWVSKTHIHQRILNRAFDDPFKLELMVKDIGIGMELARQTGVPVPLSANGQHLWKAAALAAGPGASVSELVRWVEKLTGVTIESAKGPRAPAAQ